MMPTRYAMGEKQMTDTAQNCTLRATLGINPSLHVLIASLGEQKLFSFP